jgi:hypothetical protein
MSHARVRISMGLGFLQGRGVTCNGLWGLEVSHVTLSGEGEGWREGAGVTCDGF